ncbi:SRPBCC domain-containing protein [Streptomyces sp. NPDC050560]|uniref:SRPBCC domain-containing protein n=1 Tax=Streptomyces sp. NPDC050560 TaxID=3365630 RepID=UPI0037AF5817
MTGITADGIELDRSFAAPPAAVFAAWTTPQHFARWFGGKDVQVPLDSLEFIAEPGRTWSARMVLPDGNTIDWTGEFIEVTPDERLVFTMTDRPAEPGRARIVVELTATADGTRMHFTQEAPGFSPEQKEGLLAGWQSFIDELEQTATA